MYADNTIKKRYISNKKYALHKTTYLDVFTLHC